MKNNEAKKAFSFRWFTRLILAVCAVCVMLVNQTWVYASAKTMDVFDTSSDVELTIELIHKETPVPGASFNIYRVGDISEAGVLSVNEMFSGVISVGDAKSRSEWDRAAKEILALCETNDLKPVHTVKTGTDGKATCGKSDGISAGLYLVSDADVVHNGIRYVTVPFLVSLPNWDSEESSWIHKVTASPKLEQEPGTVPTPEPTPSPTEPVDPTLPQTGLLWWPVPVLLALGVTMIAVGIVKRYFIKERNT